ncbi:MAG: glycosyltransferase 87 family protein [Actinobacteria bacterium]|nr:glycosyltransferase 87 family protein [Actinomycetota bacterium]
MTTTSEPRPWGVGRRGIALAGIAAGLMVLGFFAVALVRDVRYTDYEVYRGAVQYLLDGRGLYDFVLEGLPGQHMPFTYPPFAALVFLPSAWLPLGVGLYGWMAVLALLTVGLAAVVIDRSPAHARKGTTEGRLVLGLGAVGLLLSEPVVNGITVGQVSLALVAAVIADAVLVPPRWRGVLVGLAGAIKLTPLAFIPYFLVTRQWRAAAVASATAAGATALGFLVLPGESVRYWTQLLLDTSRVGEVDGVRNKSLLGVMAHWGIGGDAQRLLWLVLVLVLGGVALARARRHHLDGDEMAAVLVVGMMTTVVSPISWPHHLVWLPLAGLFLALRGGWARWAGWAVLVGFSALMPTISFRPDLPTGLLLLGDSATVVLVLFCLLGLPRTPSQAPAVPAHTR